jgi:hypothetical protein
MDGKKNKMRKCRVCEKGRERDMKKNVDESKEENWK